MNKNGETGGRVIKFAFEKRNGGERLVRKEPINTDEEQPFIGWIKFTNGTGKTIDRRGVAIHGIQRNNSHLSFKITDGKGTKKFTKIPLENVEYISPTQNNERFQERFAINGGKLRSKR